MIVSFRFRFFRLKYYLYLYNHLLRFCKDKERHNQIIAELNLIWERLSEAERKFIWSREEW